MEKIILTQQNFWWAFDKKEDTLIPYELFGAKTNDLPSFFVLDDWIVNNQWKSWEYAYSCVFFGEANSINEIYHNTPILNQKQKVKWSYIADEAEKNGKLDKKTWAFLIDWPKESKRLWLIDWYAWVSSIEEIKNSIFNNRPVWVGSNSINWIETRKDNIVKRWSWYGHKFIIIWYDDEKKYLICENSYGKELFDNGRFYLPYDLFDLLYPTKTANFINDTRFKILDWYLREAKKINHKAFYEIFIQKEKDTQKKWLAILATQIRYIWKINTNELKEFLK